MTTATQATDILAQLTTKAVEAFAFCADANQKILRELVDLSATTAKEGVRLYAEVQSSTLEAMKDAQAFALRRQADLADMPRDPLASYRKGMLESVEGAQKTFKLVEGNTQAITRCAERLQVTAEQASKEIQATVTTLAGKVKTLYAPAA